jgi:hypothetical protein
MKCLGLKDLLFLFLLKAASYYSFNTCAELLLNADNSSITDKSPKLVQLMQISEVTCCEDDCWGVMTMAAASPWMSLILLSLFASSSYPQYNMVYISTYLPAIPQQIIIQAVHVNSSLYSSCYGWNSLRTFGSLAWSSLAYYCQSVLGFFVVVINFKFLTHPF